VSSRKEINYFCIGLKMISVFFSAFKKASNVTFDCNMAALNVGFMTKDRSIDYMTLCGIRQLRKCDDMWYSIVHGERTLCGIGN